METSALHEGFDAVIENYFGIRKGNSVLVFIKTGRGGTVFGYNNKYLHIANQIYRVYGYTVVVSANPLEYDCDLEIEMRYIENELGIPEKIYYLGMSNGALMGAQQCWKLPRVYRMMLINGPLMINLHKTINGLRKYMSGEVFLIYGDEDPSYQYLALIEKAELPNVIMKVIAGADHNFQGREDDLTLLVIEELLG